MKKLITIIILFIAVMGLYNYRLAIKDFWFDLSQPEIPVAIEYNKSNVATQDLASEKTNISQKDTTQSQDDIVSLTESQALGFGDGVLPTTYFPANYNLDVPFTSQAPFADWNETFKEACEEASALIVHYFYDEKEFTKAVATDEILKMVDWQLDYFGSHFDLTAEQTSEMIKKYFGYKKVEVINNPTINDIKLHIYQGRPVIVPAAGRELGNPYFTQPGPTYHMLVIKGYTESQFITNDPGTKRGKNFLYNYDVIMNSIHDWNEEDILKGEPKIIVIYPN